MINVFKKVTAVTAGSVLTFQHFVGMLELTPFFNQQRMGCHKPRVDQQRYFKEHAWSMSLRGYHLTRKLKEFSHET